jgi:hypothetical protein
MTYITILQYISKQDTSYRQTDRQTESFLRRQSATDLHMPFKCENKKLIGSVSGLCKSSYVYIFVIQMFLKTQYNI